METKKLDELIQRLRDLRDKRVVPQDTKESIDRMLVDLERQRRQKQQAPLFLLALVLWYLSQRR